jgi:predicted small lipoprotein YifL
MARVISCILAACLAAARLAGCGNKGDVYLPDQQPPKKHKKSEPAPTPAQNPPAAKPADSDKTTQGSGSPDGQH